MKLNTAFITIAIAATAAGVYFLTRNKNKTVSSDTTPTPTSDPEAPLPTPTPYTTTTNSDINTEPKTPPITNTTSDSDINTEPKTPPITNTTSNSDINTEPKTPPVEQGKTDEYYYQTMKSFVERAAAFCNDLSSKTTNDLFAVREEFKKTLKDIDGTSQVCIDGRKTINSYINKIQSEYDLRLLNDKREQEANRARDIIAKCGLPLLTTAQVDAIKKINTDGKQEMQSSGLVYRAYTTYWQAAATACGARYRNLSNDQLVSLREAEKYYHGVNLSVAALKDLAKVYNLQTNSEDFAREDQARREQEKLKQAEQDRKAEQAQIDLEKQRTKTTTNSRIGVGNGVRLLPSDIDILARQIKTDYFILQDLIGDWHSLKEENLPTEAELTNLRYMLENCLDPMARSTPPGIGKKCFNIIETKTLQGGGFMVTFSTKKVGRVVTGTNASVYTEYGDIFAVFIQLVQNYSQFNFDTLNLLERDKIIQLTYNHGNNSRTCSVDGKKIPPSSSGSPEYINTIMRLSQLINK